MQAARIISVLLLCVFAASCQTTPETPPQEAFPEEPALEELPVEELPEEQPPAAEPVPLSPPETDTEAVVEDRLKSGGESADTPEIEFIPQVPPEEQPLLPQAPAPLTEDIPELLLGNDLTLPEDEPPPAELLPLPDVEAVPELRPETELSVPELSTLPASEIPPSAPQQEGPLTEVLPTEAPPLEEPLVEITSEELPVFEEPVPEGGIWNYEPTFPYIPENSIPAEEPAAAPSRAVTVSPDQYLDILYPGSGWIYLGDIKGLDGMLYYGRRLKGRDTLFSLRGKTPGSYILHFSRQDVVSDSYIDDWLEVTVEGSPYKGTERVNAPVYIPASAERDTGSEGSPVSALSPNRAPDSADPQTQAVQEVSGNQQTAADQSGASTTLPLASAVGARPASGTGVPEGAAAGAPVEVQSTETIAVPAAAQDQDTSAQLSASELLSQAEAALNSGDAAKALDLLDQFFRISVTELDKGWFLRGQTYEANGPLRNIRRALDAYKTLVDAFPSSPYWQKAQERVTYINRFYFNIN